MEYKKYKFNNYSIFKCDYSSLDDFLETIITKKTNTIAFTSEDSDKRGDSDWSGTESFKDAWNLCRYTYDEEYSDFRDKVNRISYKITNKIEYKKCYKPVGSSVNVARYLFGIPNNMRSKEPVYSRPTINIYYQIAYDSMTEIEQIKNRGILTLALINYLENIKNYKVNLNFFELAHNSNEIIYIIINLKKDIEKLKIKKCYFPIVHPSFLRRLIFRSMEIIPDLEYNWSSNGYGHPMNYEFAKMFLEYENKLNRTKEEIEKSIYISTPEELGIYGSNINEDIENFINLINYKYKINEEEKTKKFKNDF